MPTFLIWRVAISTLDPVRPSWLCRVRVLCSGYFCVHAPPVSGRKDTRMKFKRKFTSKALETEDTDYWATILASLDLQEYSIDHREKRRHCALDVFNLDGALFPSNGDVQRGIFKSENDKRSDSAITKLKTHQQKLIRQVVFEGRGYTDIARCEGHNESIATMSQLVH